MKPKNSTFIKYLILLKLTIYLLCICSFLFMLFITLPIVCICYNHSWVYSIISSFINELKNVVEEIRINNIQ